MCGIAGICGNGWNIEQLQAMVNVQSHRGPDNEGIYTSGSCGLGHNRLSIIDLSEAGRQPFGDATGRYQIIFNGEIYNYLELRRELQSRYEFRTASDTEVLLAAYLVWGEPSLHRLIGMFAFAVWDELEQKLFLARDRFGVKPLYYAAQSGRLAFASEIKALHAAGHPRSPNPVTWASYLVTGVTDSPESTFWEGVNALPAGHLMRWQNGKLEVERWYNLAERVGQQIDTRPVEVVEEEYLELLCESVRLRFRSDVPVGINLSGGLDSSLLLGLVHSVQGQESDVRVFTFATGHPDYDELPWVEQMLRHTQHESCVATLTPEEVPELAASVQWHEDEPYGGLPTLAYAKLFQEARSLGVIVLLDGQGVDEQWAGYDYYQQPTAKLVQGTTDSPVRPEALRPEFRSLAVPLKSLSPFGDALRDTQYRDLTLTKIPRALRYNDRVSMRASTELREPFLDHRLVELALRQRDELKIQGNVRKVLVRRLASRLLPLGVVEAPKRPLQTPQREWLRGVLAMWADEQIERAFSVGWLDEDTVRGIWREYRKGVGNNSFYIWQWISLGMLLGTN